MPFDLILAAPLVSIGGTARETLVQDRMRAAAALRAALTVYRETMQPNGRDYPARAHLTEAIAAHRQRVAALEHMVSEIEEQSQQLVGL